MGNAVCMAGTNTQFMQLLEQLPNPLCIAPCICKQLLKRVQYGSCLVMQRQAAAVKRFAL
ncbi:hypothetical protein D3C85_1044260 [compost metagenome]